MLKEMGKLAQVSGKDVHIDPEDHYDSWAESYNKDLLEQYGYCAHKLAVNAFQKVHANRKKPIIDVGCGTGLVGLEMARIGYETIDGLDVSKGMLDKARALGIYRKLFHSPIFFIVYIKHCYISVPFYFKNNNINKRIAVTN